MRATVVQKALPCAMLCVIFVAGLPALAAVGAANKPNIIVIVADDLGYAEVAYDGKQPLETPHTRTIATGGVSFSNGYVSCPVCSPTRAGLLTGRYQQRFGHEFNPGPARQAEEDFGLPLDQVTVADRLKKLGYATGMVGKWNLGYEPEYHPMKRGFDEFFGFLGGAHDYNDSQADAYNKILRGTTPVDEKEYLTDAFGREAVAFVDRHKEHPFFLYLTFNAVHAPLQALKKYQDRYPEIKDERRRTFAGMLAAMDDNIGALLNKLRAESLRDNSLIFFVADNGGPTPRTTSGNQPLRGYKSQVFEGGIRVPFAVQWRDKLPSGKTYGSPVIALDILPTCVAAAGGSISGDDKLDGVNLLPFLLGEQTARPHDALYWRYGQQWAIRKGDYKLANPPEGGVQLFDLASDVAEAKDISAEKPEVRKDLEAAYAAWNKQLEEPKWKGRRAVAGAAGKGKAKARRRAKADAT